MKFTKMHGLGNDFAVVAEFLSIPEQVATVAKNVCDRHFGVGADGLVFILPSEQADFRMRIFNADGTESEQCGNAVRCVGKYLYDSGMTTATQVTLQTGAGLQTLDLVVENGVVTRVTVDMGEPKLAAAEVPTTLVGEQVVQHPIETQSGQPYKFTAVSMGNPHAVIFVEALEEVDLHHVGPQIETHAYFPRKTNVEFVEVHTPTDVTMHVWERGCGETLACGSGACSVVVAGVLTGHTEREVTVHLKGGDLQIVWSAADNRVYMTGPAVKVYEATWLL
ncbi:diaminopimelate epimerase [Tumebacillus permanentifrigoris]|uniref:Diaminopimelate epimerase n=1 Tax=Tumebacillus permanentifrigoris TaxID=378543 RepID=A0A316D9A1_9BACL|nr:diaminopimelate epimerase [Tumebacillus permanentifrigoris]PWK12808.1 diaminopimelate epimerase [Tumebacillus permanentifrigoris]